MIDEEVLVLRCEGASDEEILEVNQACACFNFSKQILNRLGVSTPKDAMGYYQV
ncbi:MAG: hypothetical protein VX399_09615 [SAR324 cluster bacterium]|nr:hypothetical protein [SAR324 cluster bacterium]